MAAGRVLAVLLLAAAAAGCGSSSRAGPGGSRVVDVVAAENFWGDIARQLGGGHVAVRSLITDPATDPHQFESDAHAAALVADARIVVVNGAGYDDFVSKLLAVTSNRARVVLKVQDVLRVDHDANPHLWYALDRIPEVARAISRALVQADPTGAPAFAANLRAFDASLGPLDRLVRDVRTRYPGAPVAYTERLPGYLVSTAGLRVASPPGYAQAIEDGVEPSPRDAQTMDDLLSGRRVRALLYNSQATSPVTQHARDVARRSGVPVVAMTETQPRDEPSYQSWQRHQLEALLRALGG